MTRRTVPRLRRSPAGSDNEEVELETELRALSPDLGRPRLEENSVALPGMEGRGEESFFGVVFGSADAFTTPKVRKWEGE